MTQWLSHPLNGWYQRDNNLRAVPYDFRLSVKDNFDGFYEDLAAQIRDLYYDYGKKVILLCHSMGCLHTYHFLRFYFNQGEKDKYIKAWIPIGAPFGGTPSALHSLATGGYMERSEGKVVKGNKTTRDLLRSWTSLYYLLPHEESWPKDHVILRQINTTDPYDKECTVCKNYTVGDMKGIFTDFFKFPQGYDMWEANKGDWGKFEHPGVPVHCLMASGTRTITRLYYKKDIDEFEPGLMTEENGDGRVNSISHQICKKWTNDKKFASTFKVFKGVDHVGLVREILPADHGEEYGYLIELIKKINEGADSYAHSFWW